MLYMYISINLSIYLPTCLSMYLCNYLSIYLPIYLSIYVSIYLSIYPSIYHFGICNSCNSLIIVVSSLNRIYVARGNGMGAYMKLQEMECQVYQESSGSRYYKSYVGGNQQEGSPCWVVRMPEVWPSSKVLQLKIQDKLLQVTSAFTGEDVTSLRFRGKRTFDVMEEIVRAWDLKFGFPLCSFSFVHLDNHIGEKDWNKPIEETLGVWQPQAKAKPRAKAGAVKAVTVKKPAAKK